MTLPNSAAIAAALKRHYGTPTNMVRMLALDEESASPLEKMMIEGRGPYGRDAPPEMTKESAQKILGALRVHLDVGEWQQVYEFFRKAGLLAPTPPMQQAADSAPTFGSIFPGADAIGIADPYDHARRQPKRQSRIRAVDPSASKNFDVLFPGADKIDRVA